MLDRKYGEEEVHKRKCWTGSAGREMLERKQGVEEGLKGEVLGGGIMGRKKGQRRKCGEEEVHRRKCWTASVGWRKG